MIRKTELTAAQGTGLCPMFPCCRQSGLADRLFSLLVDGGITTFGCCRFRMDWILLHCACPHPPLQRIELPAYAARSGWMISISPFGKTRMMVTSPLCTISNSLSCWLYLASRCCSALRMSMVLVLFILYSSFVFLSSSLARFQHITELLHLFKKE